MDDSEEHEKSTRKLRKRKAVIAYDCDYGLSSDDSYEPPKVLDEYSSDDDDCIVNKKVKKGKKKKISHSNVTQEVKEVKIRSRERPPRSLSQKKRKVKNKMNLQEEDKQGKTSVPGLKKGLGIVSGLGPFSVIGHWYIAAGFMKDLTNLFKAFDEEDSWRFSAFASCWQRFKFSLIYRGRHSFKELLEFTEEICFWTKKFASPLHSMKWRVGALYALYGLYHKHPIKHCYKIRLEADDYEYLEAVAKSFQCNAENPDPAYIFYKLKADGIFCYVATSNEMGLSFNSVERQHDIMNYEIQCVLPEHTASAIFPERVRDIHKSLMKEYEKVKGEMWGDGDETVKALSYVQLNMMSEIDAVLAGLQKTHQEPTTHGTETSTVVSEIGKRRVAVRDKAAALNTTDNFLKRKQLRSPQKNPKDQSATPGSITGSLIGNESMQEDSLTTCDGNRNVMKLKKIMGLMHSPTKGTHNPIKSININRNKMLQEHLPKKKAASDTSGSCRAEDSEEILLLSESIRQTDKEEEQPSTSGVITKELVTSQNEINSQSKHRHTPRKSQGPHIILYKEISPASKIMKLSSTTGEPQEEFIPVNDKESMYRSRTRKSAILQSIVLSNKTYPEKKIEKICSHNEENKNEGQRETLLIIPSIVYTNEQQRDKEKEMLEVDYIAEDTLNKVSLCASKDAKAREMLPTKVVEMLDRKGLKSETICSNGKHLENTTEVGESFSEDQGIAVENICLRVGKNQSPLSNQPKSPSLSHSANNNHTTSRTQPQENFSNADTMENVITVQILAGRHHKKHLQSHLKAQSMVLLKVSFQLNNVMVHTTKFKMAERNLETIQKNKQKLEGFQNKFRSLLPPKYKDHKMLLQLTVDESLPHRKGTSLKHCKQNSQPLPVLPQFSSTPVKAKTYSRSEEESLTFCTQQQESPLKRLGVSDARTGPLKSLIPLMSQNAPNMNKVSINSLSDHADQIQESTRAQTTQVIQVSKPSATSFSAGCTTPTFTTKSRVFYLGSKGDHDSKPSSPLNRTSSHTSNTQDKPPKPLRIYKQVTTMINNNVLSPNSLSSHNSEDIAYASVEKYEYKTDEAERQILANENEANTRKKLKDAAVGVHECTSSTVTKVAEVVETTTELQGNEVHESFSPVNACNTASPQSNVLEDSCLDQHYAITGEVLKNSPICEKLDVHATYLNQDYTALKESIQQLYTDTCPVVSQTKINSVINEKNLILPTNSSHQHCKAIEEIKGRRRKTPKTGELSFSKKSGAFQASTSAMNPGLRSGNLHAKDKNVNVLPSPYPSTTLSRNLPQSARTYASASDVSNNSVCSFYFFSKTKKGPLPRRKIRPSSDSTVKKPRIPFFYGKSFQINSSMVSDTVCSTSEDIEY